MINSIEKNTIRTFFLSALMMLGMVKAMSAAPTASTPLIDSLLQVANKNTGTEKLNTLSKLVWNTSHDISHGMYYIDLLEDEAIRQNNEPMQGKANYYRALYYQYKSQNNDSSLYYIKKAEALKLDGKTKSDIETMRFVIYTNEGKYTLALFHVKKLLSEGAYKTESKEEALTYAKTAYIYSLLNNYTEAINDYLKSLEILDKSKDFSNEHYRRYEKLKVYSMLAGDYRHNKDYKAAISAADSARTIIDKIASVDKISINQMFRETVMTEYSEIYLDKKDMRNSRKYLDSLKSIMTDNTLPSVRYDYLSTEASYYYEEGDYKKALAYTDSLQKCGLDDVVNNWESMIVRSRILHKLNRSNEAFILYDEAMQLKDSMNQDDISRQINELQTAHEIDKARTEIEMQKTKLEMTRYIIIALVCILLLIIAFIIVRIRYNRERYKKDKKIFDQYALVKSYLEEIKLYKDEKKKLAGDAENKQNDLVEQLYNYLIETQSFKDKNIDRTKLSLALGTNRQYLTDAIREKTGKTFKDYINSIRLEYVFQLLTTRHNISIENIYDDAGFTSRSTFFRLFKEQYGMSPNELKKHAMLNAESAISRIEDIDDDDL